MSPAPQSHRWRITSHLEGTSVQEIGYVEAPDEAAAIEEAIRAYGITDPEQQKRLVAQRVS